MGKGQVYTGQSEIDAVLKDAVASLEEGGLKFEEPKDGFARGAHHCVVVLNKRDVLPERLPDELLKRMAVLTKGLLPSFALASVAAIRRNVHHIISQFPETMDSPFVANRLITDPPDGTVELMRELVMSECDTALDSENVLNRFLNEEEVDLWLEEHPPLAEIKHKNIALDIAFMKRLLREGFVDDCCSGVKFSQDARVKISEAIHGGEGLCEDRELAFSRKVALKREAFSETKPRSGGLWTPSLTLGTLLQRQGNGEGDAGEYLYCLTPACDTLRLREERHPFVMVRLEEKPDKFHLVVMSEQGAPLKLQYMPKPRNVRVFDFSGSETGRVASTPDQEGRFWFKSDGEKPARFLWLGEVRRHRANRDMADLNREWLRLGINDSEYLRLKGK